LSGQGWCQGDLTADGIVDTSDFNLWNQHKFTFAGSLMMVPEPGCGTLTLAAAILSLIGFAAGRRSARDMCPFAHVGSPAEPRPGT
jgi:hypothetical protein